VAVALGIFVSICLTCGDRTPRLEPRGRRGGARVVRLGRSNVSAPLLPTAARLGSVIADTCFSGRGLASEAAERIAPAGQRNARAAARACAGAGPGAAVATAINARRESRPRWLREVAERPAAGPWRRRQSLFGDPDA